MVPENCTGETTLNWPAKTHAWVTDSIARSRTASLQGLFILGIFGTLDDFNKPWAYYVAVASNSFEKTFELEDQQIFRFVDYRLDIPLGSGVILNVGKQKEPISMERLMSLINLPMQERSSVSNALLDARSFGALLHGNALDDRMSWAGGIFSKFIDSDQAINDAEASLVGRLTWLPYLAEDESNLLHLGVSARLSNGNDRYRFRSVPEFDKSPLFVDTGVGGGRTLVQYRPDRWCHRRRRDGYPLGRDQLVFDTNFHS